MLAICRAGSRGAGSRRGAENGERRGRAHHGSAVRRQGAGGFRSRCRRAWKTTAHRPELMQAFRGQVGSTIRHSATIGIDFLYVAVPIPGGAIRIAVPLSEIDRQARRVRGKILVSTALAFLPAIAIAAVFSRWISGRFAAIMSHAGELARGNFRARLLRTGENEFGQLGNTLNETLGEPAEDRRAAPARARRTGASGARPQGFRDQRLARAAHPAGFHPGLYRDADRRRAGRPPAQHAFSAHHPPQRRAPGAHHRRPADALAHRAEAPEIRVRAALGQRPAARGHGV